MVVEEEEEEDVVVVMVMVMMMIQRFLCPNSILPKIDIASQYTETSFPPISEHVMKSGEDNIAIDDADDTSSGPRGRVFRPL